MRRFIVVLLGLVLGVCAVCSAQLNRANLSGTVSDPSGAVVPYAKVTAVQQSTKITLSTTTNDAGAYHFVALPIGEYDIAVEHEGFGRSVRSNVNLSSASDLLMDFQLTPGSTAQNVEVNANVGNLVTERSTTYGIALDTKSIEQLPLQVSGAKRTIYSLLAAVPGVTKAGFQNNVFGGIGFSSQLLVDGVGAEYNPGVPSVAQRPTSPESVAEFKVINSTSAEYGLTGGGYISVVTKSGTNQFHGDAYEFLRNEAFDAKSYFATQRAVDKEHEYGFTLGGPIVHEKTYFFGQYDGYRTKSTTAGSLMTLPTDAFRQGNFSALLGSQIGTDALGRPILSGQIYDPTTTRNVNGQTVRDPFPGNIIPLTRLSSISAKMQSYLPGPPQVDQTKITNNYNGTSTVSSTNEPDYFIKISQMIGKQSLEGSYRFVNFSNSTGAVLPQILDANASDFGQTVHNVRVAYNFPIGSRMISSFTGGMDRQGGLGITAVGDGKTGASTIGIPGVLAKCTPFTNIQGGYPMLGNNLCFQLEGDTNWKLNETISMSLGKHTVKFGGSWYRWNANIRTENNASGTFNFNSSETGLPGAFSGQTGSGYASYFLGDVDNSSIAAPYTKSLRSYYLGVFGQDEYQVTPDLTLNVGLRYDWQPQYTSPKYDASQFNPAISNPGASGVPGALEFLGFGPGRDGKKRFGDTYAAAFGPRLGFAYKLDNNTYLRASYGLFWAPVSGFSGEFGNRQGFQASDSRTSPDGGVTSVFDWSNGYPYFNTSPTINPTIANGTATAFMGKRSAYPPQIQILNLSVQRQLPRNIVVEAAYIGNLSHHLATAGLDQINQLDYAKYGHYGNLLSQPYNSPEAVAAGISAPFANFTQVVGGPNATVAQALRPYPQYQGINGANSKIGNASYHALQIKGEKRYQSGLSFLVGYTWSKAISDIGSTQGAFAAGIQDAYNRRAEKSVTGVDQRHAVVASFAYDLPLGPGKQFLSGGSPVSRYAAGGWTLSGIANYSTGHPLGLVTNSTLPTGTESLRPDRIPFVNPLASGGCHNFNPYTDTYINRAAFADPAPFTFGNAAPRLSDVSGCANLNENLSVLKSFPLVNERVTFQLGMDFFNIFNRHIFAAPDTNIDDPGFGTISSAGNGRQGQLHAKVIW